MDKRTLRLLFLKALSRLPVRQERGNSSPQRVLVIRPDHLGDILFTIPALKALREALPDGEIAFLVGEWTREAASHNPYVDRVLTCPFPWFDRRPKGNLWIPYGLLLKEAKRLRAYGFDGALNLRYDFWWGALLAYLAGIPHRTGYNTSECQPFLTWAVPYVPGRHEVEQNMALVREFIEGEASPSKGSLSPEGDFNPLTLSPSQGQLKATLEFPLTPEEEAFGEEWANNWGSHPAVALHPGAGAPVKLWPAQKFAQLGDTLVKKLGVEVLITGAEAEKGLVKEVGSKMKSPALTLVGVTLGQLAAVLRRCALMVGADSGVLHLGVALGTPTVHLFGPVSPASFGPWGDHRRHRVVLSRLPCFPCNRLDFSREELEAHPCVRSIQVEDVVAAAESLLTIKAT